MAVVEKPLRDEGRPEHAEIHTRLRADDRTDFATKAEFELLDAQRYQMHMMQCAHLAKISVADVTDPAVLAG